MEALSDAQVNLAVALLSGWEYSPRNKSIRSIFGVTVINDNYPLVDGGGARHRWDDLPRYTSSKDLIIPAVLDLKTTACLDLKTTACLKILLGTYIRSVIEPEDWPNHTLIIVLVSTLNLSARQMANAYLLATATADFLTTLPTPPNA